MSVTKYEVGELVLLSPLIFGKSMTFEDARKLAGQADLNFGVVTGIEDTLDVWYSKQDKYKHTYTVLTTSGEVKRYFSHEIEPVENAKYYAEPRRKR